MAPEANFITIATFRYASGEIRLWYPAAPFSATRLFPLPWWTNVGRLMRRRTFLAVGISGAVTLAAAGWWAALRKRPEPLLALDEDARSIVAAIIPAMLEGALPGAARERDAATAETVGNVDRAIQGLPPSARIELGHLFALLALPPARRAFAGVASPWPEASVAEVAAFLDRWRDSGWALKRSAYDALHQLILAAWYGDERSWRAIGYPGPPQLA